MKHFYKEIGDFDFKNIYKSAVKRANPGARFIEIGTGKGESAAYMAVEIANSGKDIEFFTVDTSKGKNEEFIKKYLDVLGENDVLSKFAYVMNCDAIEFLNVFAPDSTDFIMLKDIFDPAVLWDTLVSSWELLKFGAIVAGNNYSNKFPDVKSTIYKFTSLDYPAGICNKTNFYIIR
jgi:predicted O-methyltransferase YrrM